ncbi:type I restriction enzyme, S subunit [Candidatus Electrothrix aarhusensis]|uniref:Type I restriction enzyme, S subunit n=1 Tax=Candidatus Electrothrix aarhusensis TaxID=1859131 RepID=A0A444IU06_9BACT|nr:type I restriction enzyme, S subunit [Candidatus Electrothrix aarhusensis]
MKIEIAGEGGGHCETTAKKAPNMEILSSVCEISMGQAPKGTSYNTDGEGYPLIAGAGDLGKTSPCPGKWTDAPTKISKQGDIILCIRATIGDRNWSDKQYCLGRGVAGLRANDTKLDQQYLWHWLGHSAGRLKAKGRGATFLQVSKADIASLQIPLPPLAEQKRIAKTLDTADALRTQCHEALAQLDTLLQSTFIDMFGDPVTNPMGFPVSTLSELYISKKDGTKCGPFGSALKKAELVDSGVPVWNMDNIDPLGRTTLPFRMWITEGKYLKLKAYSVIDGDVIISRAGTVGKMCVANSGRSKSIISTNLIRVRFGADLLPIYFVSLMTYCKGRVGRLKTGPDGAFTHMSTGVLDKLKFPLPPLPLQNRFATIVKSVEQQKSRMKTHLTELDTLFASLQQRAFNGEL